MRTARGADAGIALGPRLEAASTWASPGADGVPEGTPAECCPALLALRWQPIVTAGSLRSSRYRAGAPAQVWGREERGAAHGVSHRIALHEVRQHAAGAVDGAA